MKEIKITIPDDYYIIQPAYRTDDTIKIVLQKRETSLPKSWEEFCEKNPIKDGEVYLSLGGTVSPYLFEDWEPRTRKPTKDINTLPDRASAEAVLALCQLIQLRNAYNGDWVPDWNDKTCKYVIDFFQNKINEEGYYHYARSPLFFKTKELREEFLRNFRPLIEKIKPLYGIKEGGKE